MLENNTIYVLKMTRRKSSELKPIKPVESSVVETSLQSKQQCKQLQIVQKLALQLKSLMAMDGSQESSNTIESDSNFATRFDTLQLVLSESTNSNASRLTDGKSQLILSLLLTAGADMSNFEISSHLQSLINGFFKGRIY